MSEQPTTMSELLLATDQVRRMTQNKVIPTVACFDFSLLGAETRRIFQMAFTSEMARSLGIASLPPDADQITIRGQTDFWYTQNDPGFHNDRLVNLTHREGRRHR